MLIQAYAGKNYAQDFKDRINETLFTIKSVISEVDYIFKID